MKRKTTPCWFRALAVAIGLGAIASTAVAGKKDGTLDVYWIDSEGGGSTLIVTPNDESVLIDTGHPGGRDAKRIQAVAQAAGLKQIDRLIVTHFHSDHFGAAAEIAELIPIRVIHERAIPDNDPDGRTASPYHVQIKPYRELAVERRERIAPGTIIPLQAVAGGPKLELRCLAADQQFVEPTEAQRKEKNPLTGSVPPKAKDTSDNANSTVFVLEYGGFRSFHGGDLTWNLEEKLVTPYNLVGTVDVYQTNHHGLESSNNPVLIKSIAPTVSVMNNGPRKGGQPGTFAALKEATTLQAKYQVHRSMLVPPEENAPEEFIANLEEARPADTCTAHYIKMSVAPDGKQYTISIPANGHSRTYTTKAK